MGYSNEKVWRHYAGGSERVDGGFRFHHAPTGILSFTAEDAPLVTYYRPTKLTAAQADELADAIIGGGRRSELVEVGFPDDMPRVPICKIKRGRYWATLSSGVAPRYHYGYHEGGGRVSGMFAAETAADAIAHFQTICQR